MSREFGYYRHPTVWKDRIVFVSEDDLWTGLIGGGTARRLTANPGLCSAPRLSPDGRQVAYTGRDDGPEEVYLMDADGGPARRMTWMGALSQVVGWSDDGTRIIAATDWRQPFAGQLWLVEVPVDGSPVSVLPYGPARAVSFEPNGPGVVIGRNSGDPARWKRYRGGTAGTIWIDPDGTGEFRELIRLEGNMAGPIWIGRRIYFLSDHEGHGNMYSCTPTGRGIRRHTHHDEFYVRFPASDGKRIVYHAGADLYVFDPATERAERIDIRIRSSRSHLIRRYANPDHYLESFDLHPQGHSLVSVHRGGLFGMGLWEGAPVRYGAVSQSRYRLAAWLGDGKRIVALSDDEGDECLVVFDAADGRVVKRIRHDFGRPTGLYVAPGNALDHRRKARKKRPRRRAPARGPANRILIANNRHELVLVDVDRGRVRALDRSRFSRIHGAAWSPDGKWIAYGISTSHRGSIIRLRAVDSTTEVDLSAVEDFFDGFPSFDPDGKYLYFVSRRTFNPVYDSMYFDLGFPKGARPYLVPLGRETVSPFDPGTRTPVAPGGRSEDDDEENGDESSRVRIDLEGIASRVLAFPVEEARYGRVVGVRGRALFTRYRVVGSLDDDEETGGQLEAWDFKKGRKIAVADEIIDFGTSLDARVLGLMTTKGIRVVPAHFKDDPEKTREGFSRETGCVDLDRIPLAVVPAAEWAQMYGEAWRLQREHFWHPGMSGVDWEEVRERYLPVLARVGTRTEFSDLMWEVQGELGTSHCYELGGDYRQRPNWRQGHLGADIAYDRRSKRWRVMRIPQGDSWTSSARSPLAAPGMNVDTGDAIVAIGGEPVGAEVSPEERLVNMAGRDVRVTLEQGRGRRRRTITVRALSDEIALRYRDWVESNRRHVHEASRGTIGYVHIPDMGAPGYAEFHRYFGTEADRDGLIVDARYNRGGHVSQLILEKLLRRRIGYDISRWSEPLPYPEASPMGPMVALTNEYAGSDGDIFCHAFKLLGLGPLIGKRTWGGVVGIWPRAALVDGTVTTQPEFAYWFEDVGYTVENYGTEPDIEIDNLPQDYVARRDAQLDRAIGELSGMLLENPPKRPEFGLSPVTPPKQVGIGPTTRIRKKAKKRRR
jgi:tricorn protease